MPMTPERLEEAKAWLRWLSETEQLKEASLLAELIHDWEFFKRTTVPVLSVKDQQKIDKALKERTRGHGRKERS